MLRIGELGVDLVFELSFLAKSSSLPVVLASHQASPAAISSGRRRSTWSCDEFFGSIGIGLVGHGGGRGES